MPTFRIAVLCDVRANDEHNGGDGRGRCGEKRSDFALTFLEYAMFASGIIYARRRPLANMECSSATERNRIFCVRRYCANSHYLDFSGFIE